MSFARILSAWFVLISALNVAALEPPIAPAKAILPQSFAGWTMVPSKGSIDAGKGAPAEVMHEYGLMQSAAADYISGDKRMRVHAWHFGDATGAFGTFTYYRHPGMHAVPIGHDGAGDAEHYLFWTGTTVVDAIFPRPFADEKAVIVALASQIPQAGGAAGVPPSLPHYLPSAQLDPSSVRYAIGPAAYAAMGGNLPANAIDFSQDTEAVIAQYGSAGAQETLTLLLYPTPQIAGAHLKTLDALAESPGMLTKRTGPLVAIVSGTFTQRKAQQLLEAVHFSDYVTINHPEGYVPEGAKLYRLLVGITVLTVILICSAVLLGLFLGGGRALVRVMRGKPASSITEDEFISLHLEG